jgi:hypothetical protein
MVTSQEGKRELRPPVPRQEAAKEKYRMWGQTMSIFKLNLDDETAKQLRIVIFRPFVLSLVVGLGASIVVTSVAAVILGFRIQDKAYNFSLDRGDGWILFTIFITMSVAIGVVAYYRFREEHQKLVDDVLTPFRKELAGEWRVYWTDKVYSNVGEKPTLPDLDSRTGFRDREWQKCWRLIKPGQRCGAKL